MAGIDDSGRRPATAWPQAVDLARPTIARVYDYLIDGKNHFARDRVVGDRLVAAGPAVLRAREKREFLGQAVRYLAADAGVRQFLDIGTGYPVPGRGNVHEIAQAVAPESRVAYVDNDPVVLRHAQH
jgi:S-adenosyl methyltransferase